MVPKLKSVTLSTFSGTVCSVDAEPSTAAAAVDSASPAPGCCHAALSQPAEQHHWGQHLRLRSHTHYPAAPVTTHPDCARKSQLSIHHQIDISVQYKYFGMSIVNLFFPVAATTTRFKPASVCPGSARPPDRYATAARPFNLLTATTDPTRWGKLSCLVYQHEILRRSIELLLKPFFASSSHLIWTLKAFCKPRIFLLNYLKAKLTFIQLSQASPSQPRSGTVCCKDTFQQTFPNYKTIPFVVFLSLQPASPSRTTAATNIQTLPHSQTPPKRLDTPTLEEPSDLEELEQFAKTFKQRRIKLGFTQVRSSETIRLINATSVIFRFANVFLLELWAPEDVFICRFTSLDKLDKWLDVILFSGLHFYRSRHIKWGKSLKSHVSNFKVQEEDFYGWPPKKRLLNMSLWWTELSI